MQIVVCCASAILLLFILVREELYTQMVFFVQTIWADQYNNSKVVSDIIRKPVLRRIWNQKDFFSFCFS